MSGILDMAPASAAVAPLVGEGLRRVDEIFRRQLDTPLEPVAALCRHVERYRGKMLRPMLVFLGGLAAGDGHAHESEAHARIGAVIEMIHMATLVHDDVLDEADVRRGGDTVNRSRGNETAVILGDYLIARAFHLCSTLDTQRTALRIGEITSIVCQGELMQLHHRGDFELSEAEYFDIIERKTASLIGVACELGAEHAGANGATVRRLRDFGTKLGIAFQVQDDLLDLLGAEGVVGKSLGRDLEKGKLTLPLIHHLASVSAAERACTIEALATIHAGPAERRDVSRRLESTGSIGYARAAAAGLVAEAKGLLMALPETPAREALAALADAVIHRAF